MWREYDPKTVREELAVLREHGLTMTRSFFYWPDFHPEPFRIDEELCDRFRDFLDAHTEAEWEPSRPSSSATCPARTGPGLARGRDLYEDVWLVGRQPGSSPDDPALQGPPAGHGWLITNEMPGYGRVYQENRPPATWSPPGPVHVRRRPRAGGTQPVSLATALGHRGHRRDNGFSLRDTASTSISSARTSTARTPTGPPALPRGLRVRTRRRHRSAGRPGGVRPVHRHRLRGQRRHLLPADPAQLPARGATGWIAWNNTDYDALWTARLRPPPLRDALRHHRQRRTPQGATAGTRRFRRRAGARRFRRCRAPTRTPPWWSPLSWNAATPTAAPPTAR